VTQEHLAERLEREYNEMVFGGKWDLDSVRRECLRERVEEMERRERIETRRARRAAVEAEKQRKVEEEREVEGGGEGSGRRRWY
jgi:hypothetical protein